MNLALHGAQKLFGWFGGAGPQGTGHFFDGVGMRPGRAMAILAGCAEVVGGVLFALGLLGRAAGRGDARCDLDGPSPRQARFGRFAARHPHPHDGIAAPG